MCVCVFVLSFLLLVCLLCVFDFVVACVVVYMFGCLFVCFMCLILPLVVEFVVRCCLLYVFMFVVGCRICRLLLFALCVECCR